MFSRCIVCTFSSEDHVGSNGRPGAQSLAEKEPASTFYPLGPERRTETRRAVPDLENR